jgi:hypothetical protein
MKKIRKDVHAKGRKTHLQTQRQYCDGWTISEANNETARREKLTMVVNNYGGD